MLIIHGRVYTMDSSNAIAEAMAIKDGRVEAIGLTNELLKKFHASDTINAGGLPVFPGFFDAHCHFYGLARNLRFADLVGCTSFEEVMTRLIDFNSQNQMKWLAGRGWDQNLWAEKVFPDREILDRYFPDIPVVLIRIDGHVVLANQMALIRAGFNRNHSFQENEVWVRNGRLTGILCERAADLMKNMIPRPNQKEMAYLIQKAQRQCLSLGLTGIADAGLERREVLLLDSLQQAGTLSLRIYVMLTPDEENIKSFITKEVYQTDRIKVRGIKIYVDGSLGSRTALLKKPYFDEPGTTGILVTPVDSILRLCQMALEHGYQVCTHAIGDSANKIILETYCRLLKGKNDLRWRIEHAQVVDLADVTMFASSSIIPSIQATHATSDMYWAGSRLGTERLKGAYAYHTLLQQNGWLANGTDFPIEKSNPLLTFYAAVTRKDLSGNPPGGFLPEQALTREEALQSMTIWAARACFWDHELGSLEAGKKADFVILDRDIMTIPPNEIPVTEVVKTFIDGKEVYTK